MRISLKFIAYLWLGLFLLIGGLLYNAYSKLKPETFIALITEQVQKNYPGAKLEVGKVSYSFSLDFNLNLRNIHLRRPDKLLGSIGEVQLRVPWWLLLFNRGNAQINVSNLDIFIDHAVDEIPKATKSKHAAASSRMISVSLPKYLAEAKFTLRAKEVSIRDIQSGRRYFVVSKLLVREFQYGKNSAFELNIPIQIKHRDVQYTSDLWLFGDITPETSLWRLNYRGEFRTREANDRFQIEDLVINGKASFVPSSFGIRSELGLLIDKVDIGQGQLIASQEGLTLSTTFTKLPMTYFGFLYEEIQNPYLEKLDAEASGAIKYQRNFDEASSSVNGKLTFDGPLRLSGADSLQGKWQIGFQDGRWEVSFMSPKGEASFFRRSVMDPKKSKVTQFSEELGFSGLDLNLVVAPLMNISQFIAQDSGPYFTTSVSYKNCTLGDKMFNGNFRYGKSPDQEFYTGELKDPSTAFAIAYSHKSNQRALDVTFSKFTLVPQFQILSPLFSATGGSVDGKLEGRWNAGWESGQWLVQITAKDLTGAVGRIPDFMNRSYSFFGVPDKNTQLRGLNMSVKNSVLNISSLLLEGPESIKLTGSLGPKQKSTLTLSYPKNKRVKPVKKEVIEPYWMQKEAI